MTTQDITRSLIYGLHAMVLLLTGVMFFSATPPTTAVFALATAAFIAADLWLLIIMIKEKGQSTIQQKALLVLVDLAWVVLLSLTYTAAWIAFPLFFLQFIVLGELLGLLPVSLMLLVTGYVYSQDTNFPLPASIIGPTIGALVAFALTAGYSYIVRENNKKQELIQELQNTQEHLLHTERSLGIEQERSRLAAEIHDTVAQGLASINLVLSAAQQQLRTNPDKAQELIELAEHTASSDLVEVRGFIADLSHPHMDKGFTAGLTATVQEALLPESLPVHYESTGPEWPLSSTQQQNLLRITRATLANIVRHAQAANVTITTAYTDNELTLSIADDGVGFTPTITRGRGLFFATERAATLGGSLTIDSTPGAGTIIKISIPRTLP